MGMSQKVPFILGDLQNVGLDGNQVSNIDFDEAVPSPVVEELSDHEWSDVINDEIDMSVFNKEPTEKIKKKKNKAEKKLLNNSMDKSDAESNSNDLDGQRHTFISSVLDSSFLNDSTASTSSSRKNKKKKRKDEEKVATNDTDSKDENEDQKTRETLISSVILNSSLASSTCGKKSKKKKKDKEKEKDIDKEPDAENGPEVNK